MTTANTAFDDFHYKETFGFLIDGKNRDGTDLSSPDTQTILFALGRSEKGSPLVTFSASPQVTQPLAGTATWYIQLAFADYDTFLTEGKTRYYNVWSTLGAADPILQAHGTITLGASIKD